MSDEPAESESLNSVRESFLGTLLVDVVAAMERRASQDDQSNRRELIRTLFAAIEGMVWTYREHIASIAKTMELLTPAEESVFSETSYTVTKRGKLVAQARFVPLLSMIRFTTVIAAKIDRHVTNEFADESWSGLRRALEIRHRVTHPKSKSDLILSAADVTTCYDAFGWVFEFCVTVMDSTLTAAKYEAAQFHILLKKLKEGDPDIIAEYRTVAASMLDQGLL